MDRTVGWVKVDNDQDSPVEKGIQDDYPSSGLAILPVVCGVLPCRDELPGTWSWSSCCLRSENAPQPGC